MEYKGWHAFYYFDDAIAYVCVALSKRLVPYTHTTRTSVYIVRTRTPDARQNSLQQSTRVSITARPHFPMVERTPAEYSAYTCTCTGCKIWAHNTSLSVIPQQVQFISWKWTESSTPHTVRRHSWLDWTRHIRCLCRCFEVQFSSPCIDEPIRYL